MRRISSILVLIGIAMLLAMSMPTDMAGQDSLSPLYIEDLQGTKTESGTVLVTGKVVNPLPWDAVDVEVTVLFEQDLQDPLASQIIGRIPAGKSAGFVIKKTSKFTLRTFRTGITSYTLRSDDVPGLLDLYHITDNPVLQVAIVRAFHQMGTEALPALLASIDVANRPAPVSLEQIHADLMCLDALTALGDPRAVQPVLELLAWYDQNNEMSLTLLKDEILLDPYSPISELSILEGFDFQDGSLDDLVGAALVSVGTSGIPHLIRATNSDSPAVREIAQTTLAELNKVTVDALLDESDPMVLADIIAALGEIRRGDAIIPLLELAHDAPSLLDAVDSSLLEMGSASVPGLVSALRHPIGAIADHAEHILREEANEVVPELRQALRDQGQPAPADANNADALVTTLRDRADAQINAEIDAIFERGWALFQTGDCAGAVEAMDAMFAVRDNTTRHAAQAARVYQCQARTLAETKAYSQAITLGLQAEQLNPDSEVIRTDLTNWFIAQGQVEYNARHWEEAAAQFQFALERDATNLAARRSFGRVILSANLSYMLVGVVCLAVFIVVSSYRSRTRRGLSG